MELQQIKVRELDLSLGRLRLIPHGAVLSMARSLRGKGQLSPLVAAPHEGRLVLVDGFVRRQAALQLGLDTLMVEVLELGLVQMKAQVYLRNRDRPMALIEECRLVYELCELDGLSQVEVGELLERHKTWICRRLALYRDLSPQLLEEHAVGLLGPGSIRRLAQLPARNQEKLVAVGRHHKLAARQMAQFVELWQRTTDPEAREYLLTHPRQALEHVFGTAQRAADPRMSDAARRLLIGLEGLGQISLRLERRLHGGLGEPSAEGVALLGEAHQRAEQLTRAALDAVGGWLRRRGGV
jgi:ParB-like chromosome segregation protein Spo0J